MTAREFRRFALGLPQATEGQHMNHPDFRVRGKIFATLHSNEKMGVVMLTPAQQRDLVREAPAAFAPAKGAWGRRGCTQFLLTDIDASTLKHALGLAHANKAQKG